MNRDAQLAAGDSKVGFHEGANNDQPFGVWQGVRNAAWCDSFAQWMAVLFGGFRWLQSCQFGEKGDAYTPYTVAHAKEMGLWRSPGDALQPGWQVLFDWNANGVADHIGTVVKDRGDGTFITIEGNYHDQVAYVVRDRKFLLGWVALPIDSSPPPYVPGPARDEFKEKVMAKRELSVTTPHMTGQDVKTCQVLMMLAATDLTGTDYLKWVDGDYGPKTAAAVKTWQGRTGKLTADGVCGPATWAWLVGV